MQSLLRLLVWSTAIAATVGVYAVARDDWGKPLGRSYAGPEVSPRTINARGFELGADERTTIAIFEQAARSVVFIANTAIRRGPWTLNVLKFLKARVQVSYGMIRVIS